MSDFLYRKNKKFYLALLLPALVLYGGARCCLARFLIPF